MTEQNTPAPTGTASSGQMITLELTLRDPGDQRVEPRPVVLGHQPVVLIEFDLNLDDEAITKVRVDATGFDIGGLAGLFTTLAGAYTNDSVMTRTDGL